MNSTLPEDKFHKKLIDNLYDGVYFVDPERRITYWNKGAERITGYLSEMVVGTLCNQNLLNHVTDGGKHLCEDGCPLAATLDDGEQREAEVHLRHAEGHRVPVLIRVSPIKDADGNVIGAVEVFSNNQSLFTMRRKLTAMEFKAMHDALTGLLNRGFAEARIHSALEEFRQHGLPFGFLMIDVDRFKSVNDTHGHAMGDQVLKTLARTFDLHLRTTDICGRWGGEEFVVALMNMDERRLMLVAEKLRTMIEQSVIHTPSGDLNVTISIGATLAHENDTLESLLERADALLYESKQTGRNRVTFRA